MGLCFSYQQARDLERISNLFSSYSLFKVNETHKGDIQEEPNTSCDDHINKEEHESPTCESKHLQADPIPPPSPLPSFPSPSVFAPTPEALAREERRRKRDERRAARQQNEEKCKLDLHMLPEEHLEDRCKINIQSLHAYDVSKKCLVLDIDYTIFDHKSDFELALEFKRPYLHEFLKICGKHYNIVIWSATAYTHIHTKMEKLQLFDHPDFNICFVLSRDHMIPHAFSHKRKTYVQDIKPLPLLWKKFPEVFNPENTIHIDDVEENFVLNPRNGLRIDPFRDALLFRQTDRELFYLAQYLIIISNLPSFEPLDHSRWKDYIINTLWDLQTTFSLPTFTAPCAPSTSLLEHHLQSIEFRRSQREAEREEKAKVREEQRIIEGGKSGEEWDRVLQQELEKLAKESGLLNPSPFPSPFGTPSPSPYRTPSSSSHPSPMIHSSPSPKLHNSPYQSPAITVPQPSPKIHNYVRTKQPSPNLSLSSSSPSPSPSPSSTPSPSPSPSLSPTTPLHWTPKLSPKSPKNPTKLSPKLSTSLSHLAPPGTPSLSLSSHEKRHRRERSRGKEEKREEGGGGGAKVKADWVVTDMHLLDLIRDQTTDILLPSNSPILHAN